MELSETVGDKLAEAVEAWADENLEGLPAVLAHSMYSAMKEAMEGEAEKIHNTFRGNGK